VRINAYEGLLNHRYPAIESRPFPHILDGVQNNFVLDIIHCGGLTEVKKTK